MARYYMSVKRLSTQGHRYVSFSNVGRDCERNNGSLERASERELMYSMDNSGPSGLEMQGKGSTMITGMKEGSIESLVG